MPVRDHALLVDDDPRYLRLIRLNLEAAGYRCSLAQSGADALEHLAREPADVILLDVRMSEMDGFSLLERIREFSDVPVIFVSALGEEADKVRGLRLGADDYLTKPFAAGELIARVAAVLRRYRGETAPGEVTLGDVQVDLAQHLVLRSGRAVPLSRTEFRLLAALARHLGKVVPQDQLVREVWGPTYEEGYEGLRVYVHRLRQKLEADPDRPALLLTVPGVGYELRPPDGSAPVTHL